MVIMGDLQGHRTDNKTLIMRIGGLCRMRETGKDRMVAEAGVRRMKGGWGGRLVWRELSSVVSFDLEENYLQLLIKHACFKISRHEQFKSGLYVITLSLHLNM